jgi:hypothetical protein
MIVHDAERWVYLGIPKTASTALHRFFEGRGARATRDYQHDMQVPEACRSWLVFASTLNPFRRAHSLWRMLQGDARKGARWAGDLPADVIASFPHFVDELLLGPDRGLRVFQGSMTAWIERIPPGIQLRLVAGEDLEAGLRELGLLRRGERVPQRNRSRGDLRDAYDAATAEGVRRWAAEDFTALGYSPRLEDWTRPPVCPGRRGPWRLLGRRRVRVLCTTGSPAARSSGDQGIRAQP